MNAVTDSHRQDVTNAALQAVNNLAELMLAQVEHGEPDIAAAAQHLIGSGAYLEVTFQFGSECEIAIGVRQLDGDLLRMGRVPLKRITKSTSH